MLHIPARVLGRAELHDFVFARNQAGDTQAALVQSSGVSHTQALHVVEHLNEKHR